MVIQLAVEFIITYTITISEKLTRHMPSWVMEE